MVRRIFLLTHFSIQAQTLLISGNQNLSYFRNHTTPSALFMDESILLSINSSNHQGVSYNKFDEVELESGSTLKIINDSELNPHLSRSSNDYS